MNQDEFIEKYQKGERDFSNQTIDFSVAVWGSNFQNINLHNSVIRNATFVDTDFSNSDLSNANFQHTTLREVNLSHSNIIGTIFLDVVLDSVSLQGAKYDPSSTLFPIGFNAQDYGAEPLQLNFHPQNLDSDLSSNPHTNSEIIENPNNSPFYGVKEEATISEPGYNHQPLFQPQTVATTVSTQPLAPNTTSTFTTSTQSHSRANIGLYVALSIFLGIVSGAGVIGLVIVSNNNYRNNSPSVSQTATQTPRTPTPAPNIQSETISEPTPTPSPQISFQESCGSPSGSGSVWWAVMGPASMLNRVKNNFCGDAYVTSGNTQVASFTSENEAQEFATSLAEETGENFWVKAPRVAVESPAPSNNSWRSSCGSPAGSGSRWWGVRGPSGALSMVKSNYCGDALVVRGNTQAASFTSASEAQNFANFLSRETGYSFWVSQPSN